MGSSGALAFAKDALAAVQERQKLIKLVNKNDAGWLGVAEYESELGIGERLRRRKANQKSSKKGDQQEKANMGLPVAHATFQTGDHDQQLFRHNIIYSDLLSLLIHMFAWS